MSVASRANRSADVKSLRCELDVRGERVLDRAEWFEFSRVTHRLAGLFMPPEIDEHDAEDSMRLRIAGIHGDGFSK